MENEVLKCIYTRRSVRSFKDKLVPKEIIEKILKAGVMAPSAMNKQPWNFSVVEGKGNITRFGEKALKGWNLMSVAARLGVMLKKADSIFFNAPLLIVVSGKKKWMFLKDDINLCVENMFLAAHSLGIGSCWIGFALPLDKDKTARKELGIPMNNKIVAPLVFGYPMTENKRIPERKVNILKWIK
ncbi:MAG: nitroreductase [Nanoarchaeota archaeon]|nr:nitroreductase [Nanoarchaeota archaeon]